MPPLKASCGTGGFCKISVLLVIIGLAAMAFRWSREAPRRNALDSLVHLNALVAGASQGTVSDVVVFPDLMKEKSREQASRWLRDVLRDELSPEGVAALRKEGDFGKLTDLFPEHALSWAKAAGAAPDECLALRMDRAGVTAEVVLVPGPHGFRISRCNNVKQMASPTLEQ